MSATQSRGMVIAVIQNGRVVHVRSYGDRNANSDALQTNTIMYGVSLTKFEFSFMVMQLVEEGHLDLDRPLSEYWGRPLPEYPTEDKYAPWVDLANDLRWRSITARHLLTHGVGFANFAFVEPDGKIRFHFDPGTRYAYSGAPVCCESGGWMERSSHTRSVVKCEQPDPWTQQLRTWHFCSWICSRRQIVKVVALRTA